MARLRPQSGLQLSVDVLNAPLAACNDVVAGTALAMEIAQHMGARVVDQLRHQFELPHQPGFTTCVLLDTSHVAIHSHSENRSISIDAFYCGGRTEWTSTTERMLRERYPGSDVLVTVTPRCLGAAEKTWLPPIVDNATLETKVEACAESVTVISPRLFNEFNDFGDTVASNVHRGVHYTYVVPTARILDYGRFTESLTRTLRDNHGLDEVAAEDRIRECVTSYVLDSDKMAIPWEMGVYSLPSHVAGPRRVGFVEHPNRQDHNLVIVDESLVALEQLIRQIVEMSTLGAQRVVSDLTNLFDNLHESAMLLPRVIKDVSPESGDASVVGSIETERQLQSVLHVLLRSRYDTIQREQWSTARRPKATRETPRRPDFALPGLGIAIEVKHGAHSDTREIRRTILDYQDMMRHGSTYHTLVVFVYDPDRSAKLRELEDEYTSPDHTNDKGLATHVIVRPS